MSKLQNSRGVRTVLVVDDQPDVRGALRMLLKANGISSVEVDSPVAALEQAARQAFACALIDLNYTRDTTSGEEGLQLLKRLREVDPDLPVVVMTAWSTVPLTVEAMRDGAADFVEKPWDNARLLSVVGTQTQLGDALREQRRLQAENALLRSEDQAGGLIAHSQAMQRVISFVGRIAPSDANVLILGENGTGKGLLAQHIHDHSLRRDRSLVKVNMGGIPETVFESEMFGHMRGAFTDAKSERIGRFELAHGGTLFMDEVGNVPAAQQPKLLRVLEDGEFERLGSSRTQHVDVRLISATNANLNEDVAEGRFRRDLLYRLNTLEIMIPPLRDREADILPLARSFLKRSAQRYGRGDLRLAPSAERALLAYSWPGNVRELEHMMERAALLSDHDQVDTGALAFSVSSRGQEDFEQMTLDQAESWLVRRAVGRFGNNLQRAADALGITRQALYRRMEKYGLREAGEISEGQ